MARKTTPRHNTTRKTVETLKHDAVSRTNIPTAEYQSVMRKEEQSPIRVAYERRNRDLDPQLVWRGKDAQDWSDLVVHAPPLYIQEKVHPKVIIDDLVASAEWLAASGKHATEHTPPGTTHQLDLFADFNGIPRGVDKTEFYRHEQNWSNRMILGDSLQVMASLAEREGLRGKVQCIYLDPPYGIKFNSNFQWSTTSRDVKDGNVEHITREPEQVKAFRDTWRDGIHSYLTYLRDRLTVARDLLADSGSIFVQIGDENVHRVRAVMDEVFGEENFVAQIATTKTAGQTDTLLPSLFDILLWYARDTRQAKFRRLFRNKGVGFEEIGQYYFVQQPDGIRRRMTDAEISSGNALTLGSPYRASDISSNKPYSLGRVPFEFDGKQFLPPEGRYWTHSPDGRERLQRADRLIAIGKSVRFVGFLMDDPVSSINNQWTDTGISGFASEKVYVVQTSPKLIERCILMATDPGDLVLDPTCGSGTTAYVAEQWGRRWITIDTSRVALALARARIMGARYPYYLLADSPEGQRKEAEITRSAPSSQPTRGDIRQGFVYERVPHITLKSIANNAEIDVIWEQWEQQLAPLRSQLSVASGQATPLEEWQIPREKPSHWPQSTQALLTAFWQARIARQQEIDASIAARAEFEYLYDRPYDDRRRVRVAGPFTVESLSPHRVLGVDEDDNVMDSGQGAVESGQGAGASVRHASRTSHTTNHHDFAAVMLEHLKTAGVQQAHKDDKITLTSLTPWPGKFVCAEGRFSSAQWPVASGQQEPLQVTGHTPRSTELRAAIFIGPEFGTVSRPDLVEAAREAGDADFDVLIACAFNYDAHSSEFDRLGRIPILKARMNADLHMADDLKNTGKGNLFVIFGEPDVAVTSGQWLVARHGRLIANYEYVKELSGLGSLEEINRLGRDGNLRHAGGKATDVDSATDATAPGAIGRRWSHAQRTQTLAALEALSAADFPLALTTDHKSQVTVYGVDVFHPNTGEVRSDGPEGIACWFIDTDYNEESFFVRHAYFLGASDPYKALKTTLKAEINEDAWSTLHSDTSRPFDKPGSGRIAVKVINHLGDEVMKVFRV